jgi:hypothetical protein
MEYTTALLSVCHKELDECASDSTYPKQLLDSMVARFSKVEMLEHRLVTLREDRIEILRSLTLLQNQYGIKLEGDSTVFSILDSVRSLCKKVYLENRPHPTNAQAGVEVGNHSLILSP